MIPYETVQLDKRKCHINKFTYQHANRSGLQLIDANSGEFVMSCTVNLPHEECEPGHVFIQDEQALEILIKAGVVSYPIDFTKAHLCELLI